MAIYFDPTANDFLLNESGLANFLRDAKHNQELRINTEKGPATASVGDHAFIVRATVANENSLIEQLQSLENLFTSLIEIGIYKSDYVHKGQKVQMVFRASVIDPKEKVK